MGQLICRVERVDGCIDPACFGYSMKGNFATAETVRDPGKHTLEINVNAGTELTDVLSKVKLERASVPDFGPKIRSFIDGVSGTTDSIATPGGIFKIVGERLRIGGPRPDNVGLYLQAQDVSETKVNILLENDPARIRGQLPSTLASGKYRLLIKTQVGSSNQVIINVRVSVSSFTLNVQ